MFCGSLIVFACLFDAPLASSPPVSHSWMTISSNQTPDGSILWGRRWDVVQEEKLKRGERNRNNGCAREIKKM